MPYPPTLISWRDRWDELPDEVIRTLISDLLKEQFRYAAVQLNDDAARWSADFISDDGTDYTRTCLNACEALMDLRYEGTREDIYHFLFTPREAPPSTDRIYRDPLTMIDSAGGLCPLLADLSNYIIESTED